jgi:glycosyltransferase involved in cell wall biosynthesis
VRIGIDASFTQAFPDYQAGLHQYLCRLVCGLQDIDPDNDYTLYFFGWRHEERGKAIANLAINENVRTCACPLPYRVVQTISRLGLPVSPFLEKVDVFHGPTFRLIPRSCFRKSIVTIHDLKFLTHPELFPNAGGAAWFTRQARYAVKRADVLVAVSHATRDDIMETFGVPSSRIRVVYPGVGKEFVADQNQHRLSRLRARYGIDGDYILFVGYFEEKKNLIRLLEAFAAVQRSLTAPFQLVLAGQEGPSSQAVRRKIQELSLGDAVVLTGYVPSEELPLLYAGASLFVFPSLHEGFGIPPLEAMACGAPVVASRIPAVSEVVGRAGYLIDPHNVEDITHAILSVLTQDGLRMTLRQRGLERASRFSWEGMARQMLELYKELL